MFRRGLGGRYGVLVPYRLRAGDEGPDSRAVLDACREGVACREPGQGGRVESVVRGDEHGVAEAAPAQDCRFGDQHELLEHRGEGGELGAEKGEGRGVGEVGQVDP